MTIFIFIVFEQVHIEKDINLGGTWLSVFFQNYSFVRKGVS